MSKFILAFIFGQLLLTDGFSQVNYTKVFNIPSSVVVANGIEVGISGEHFLCGQAIDTALSKYYTYLTKVDQFGNVNWVKYYNQNTSSVLKRFLNGDLLLAGSTTLSRIDSSGNVIWTNSIINVDINRGECVITSDGGIVIAAPYRSIGVDPNVELFKLDSLGNMLWSTKTPGYSNTISSTKIIHTTDGGFLLVYNVYMTNLDLQIFIIKTDSLGNMTWSKSYGQTYWEEVKDMIQSSDGNFVFAGHVSRLPSVFKIDTTGTILWLKTYSQNLNLKFYKLLESSDGNLVLGGYYDNTVGLDLMMMKTNSTGNFLFANLFSAQGQGIIHDIVQTDDFGYMAFGQDNYINSSGNMPYNSIQLVKMDSMFNGACNFQAGYFPVTSQTLVAHLGSYLSTDTITSIASSTIQTASNFNIISQCQVNSVNEVINDGFIIYPNPAGSTLNIQGTAGSFEKITIYNIAGKLIKIIPCSSTNLEIDISSLSSGFYFLESISDQRLYRKRFVKN